MSGTARETDGATYMPNLTDLGSGLPEELLGAWTRQVGQVQGFPGRADYQNYQGMDAR